MIPRNREVNHSSIMHRYNTRFQARQAPKEQESQLTKDIRALQPLLDRQCTGVDRIKNSIEVFSFLADRSTLLRQPTFREVVIKKIDEFRPEMEKRKNDAIQTFVSTYSPSNSYMEQHELLSARDALYYIPRLAAKIDMVEVIIRKQAK